METWQATIKEKGSEHLLKPEYHLGNMFDYIKDIHVRQMEIRKYLRQFWGLDNPDVEWYKLEKL